MADVVLRDRGSRHAATGSPPDLLPRVFERFAKGARVGRDRAWASRSRATSSSAHGGTIDARNEAGGAVVEFTLPA